MQGERITKAFLRPTAPGAGCLGKSADFPLWLTFQSAEESFGRRPDRIAPHEPTALSAALRNDLNRSSAAQDADFQSARPRLSNRATRGASGGVKEEVLRAKEFLYK